MTPEQAFFTVHCDLPREGPGLPEDVIWALDIAGIPPKARILDAGCGPGADTVTLAQSRPDADILSVDLHKPFVEQTRRATAQFGTRVRAEVASYMNLEGPFDFMWCAGAIYFEGVISTLTHWRADLAIGGRIAFSEPVRVTEPASDKALTFWDGYTPLRSPSEMEAELSKAGWGVLGQKLIIGPPWAAYYEPMKERLEMLRSQAPNDALLAAIDEAAAEIDQWKVCRDEIAYGLFVVHPA